MHGRFDSFPVEPVVVGGCVPDLDVAQPARCLDDHMAVLQTSIRSAMSRSSGGRYVGTVSDVVRIELGVSILQGELIAREAEAAGLRVRLRPQ